MNALQLNKKTIKTLNDLQDLSIDLTLVLINELFNDVTLEKYINKGGYECYNFISNEYILNTQPNRKEIILKKVNDGKQPTNLMELHGISQKGVNLWTRGDFLNKLVFKDTKKDKAIKEILKACVVYHANCDMKHSFKITQDVLIDVIKKYFNMDNNKTTLLNGIVKKDHIMNSKKMAIEEEEGN